MDRKAINALLSAVDVLKNSMLVLAKDVCEAKQFAKAAAEGKMHNEKMAEYRKRLGDIP